MFCVRRVDAFNRKFRFEISARTQSLKTLAVIVGRFINRQLNKMEELRPNEQRAKNAITLIWIVLVLEIISLISGYFQYDLLQSVANGAEISAETASANDNREQIIAIIYMIAMIISAVTFIQWFRRAYYNLHLKVNYLAHTEGWAAGSWFVPIVSLYRPYQIMKELYQETKELLTKKGISFNQNFTTNSLGLWWTLWIIDNILGQFIYRYSLKADTIDELTVSTVASIVSNIVGIPLALLAIKVIRDYSTVEPLLIEIKADEETKDNEETTNR